MTEYIPIEEPRSPAEMQSLSRDDLTRLIAQRTEMTSRPSLVESLIITGRFDEALLITNDEEQIRWINKLKKAESRDDDHRCQCTSTADFTDYVRYPNAEEDGRQDIREMPRYMRTFRHFSLVYNDYITFYQCQECGCVQSLTDDKDIDELHAKFYINQQDVLTRELKTTPVRKL